MKPKNQEIRSVFDAVASRYERVTSSYAIRRRAEFFLARAKGKCLEVGAGTGRMAQTLVEAGHKVTAMDISPNMAAEMKKKGLDAIVGDAERLPFPDASFDTVLASEVLYYLDDPKAFLLEARRVLKPGGILLLSSANGRVAKFYDSLRGLLRKFGLERAYFDDPIHNFFSETELRRLLEKAEFREVQIKKILVLPISMLDWLNKLLEFTPAREAGAFILLSARRQYTDH